MRFSLSPPPPPRPPSTAQTTNNNSLPKPLPPSLPPFYSRPAHRSTAEHVLVVCKDPDAVAVLAALSAEDAAAAEAGRAHNARAGAGGGGGKGGPGGTLSLAAKAGGGAAFATQLQHQQQPSSARSGAATPWSARPGRSDEGGSGGGEPPSAPVATSAPHQVTVLSARFLRSWARTPALAGIQVAQYTFFAVLLGATYWGLGGPQAAKEGGPSAGVFDRVASLWFVVLVTVLQPGANACTIMYGQKALLRRESTNGLYKPSAFFIAKSLTSLPFQVGFAVVFNTIIYFAVGYQRSPAKFAVFFGVNLLAMLVSESLGVLAAALSRSELVGQIFLSAAFVPLLMYTGFIQTRTPTYLAWLKRVSFAAYAYAALVANEFDGLRLPSPNPALPPIKADPLVPKNVRNGLSIGADVGILVAFLAAFRVGAYLLFARAIRLRRL